ncbi:O-antigen ligase family protein [Prosthecobacter sp.]|uniref:O-antigen ligase family protein n=1 Tax=Prosthecobacter sp. TaxID=1965333 RepID=UPI003782F2E6
MLLAFFGIWRRPEGFKLDLLLKSPADYLVVAYLLWIIYTTGDYVSTAKAMIPFAGFYFASAIGLDSLKRMSTFLNCWVVGLIVVAIFGISTELGFELAPGSSSLTASFFGRLALNTWIYNNPNALGHGVVIILPLAYFWFVWKRGVLLRTLGFFGIAAGAYCVYLTQSKGAYLCGAAAATAGLLFRKARYVQVFLITVMMTAGIGALKLLPRMESLSAKEDGIEGRLMIWQLAYNAMQSTFSGEGWKRFEAWIETEQYGLIKKATHGSYVNVGADLGYPGLFLFVGILYACFRTVLQTRPAEDDLQAQRIQRALLTLVSGYAASAWMIDRAYHTDYFFIAGVCAAYHRVMSGRIASSSENSEEPVSAEVSDSAGAGGLTTGGDGGQTLVLAAESADVVPRDFSLSWRRLGLGDMTLIAVSFYAVVYCWHYLMTNFIQI